jgi:transposase
MTFVAAVDAPDLFPSSRDVGPHFGLTPEKYQSDETDRRGHISGLGARRRPACRASRRVPLARKLAVMLHRMLKDGTSVVPHKSTLAMAA